jgi:hypothetical protein
LLLLFGLTLLLLLFGLTLLLLLLGFSFLLLLFGLTFLLILFGLTLLLLLFIASEVDSITGDASTRSTEGQASDGESAVTALVLALLLTLGITTSKQFSEVELFSALALLFTLGIATSKQLS